MGNMVKPITVIKLSKGEIWELKEITKPRFDPTNTWMLVTRPIGGKPKEIKWLKQNETKIAWTLQTTLTTGTTPGVFSE